MRRLAFGSAACTLAMLASVAAAASETVAGSAEPSGKIIPDQDASSLTADNASPLEITSNLPATAVRVTVYRKANHSDAVTSNCVTPCRQLIPKRYGFSVMTDVPAGKVLSSEPITFAWSQPWWCRGGVLCKTDLKPRNLALKIDPAP